MLFLSGGGTGSKSEEIDRLFIEHVDKSKPILYIPIAIDTAKHPYPDCLKWMKNNFSKFGYDKIVMWTETELLENAKSDPSAFGGIYIGGGNTHYLLKNIRDSGFSTFILRAHGIGIAIAGGSAGAIIFGRSILPAFREDDNIVSITDFTGLNIVKDIDLWPHYSKSEQDQFKEAIKQYGMKKIIAIPEDSAVCFGKEAIVIGKSPVTIASNNEIKEIMPNNKIRF